MSGGMQPIEEIYSHREMASQIAAERVATALKRRLRGTDETAMVLGGGSTPVRCLEVLSQTPLDWSRVTVTLSDERWVPPTHEASNERMVRESFLRGPAADASLVPLYRAGIPAEEACASIDPDLRDMPKPFACALLGMGEDGHFASLFPDYPGLGAALAPDGERLCVPVTTSASPHRRVSLTLSALIASDEILLLIFGKSKRRVYEAAREGDMLLPIRALLDQASTTLRVVWAP